MPSLKFKNHLDFQGFRVFLKSLQGGPQNQWLVRAHNSTYRGNLTSVTYLCSAIYSESPPQMDTYMGLNIGFWGFGFDSGPNLQPC